MYKYTHFIKENIAPAGATKIAVYSKSSGDAVGTIPLGKLKQPEANKLYSFMILSDVHVQYETAGEDLLRVLNFAEANCDFVCICGDLTETAAIESQLAEYKTIITESKISKPVYAIAGNHENYNGYSDKYLKNYTGQPLYYSFNMGNDVFVMVGHFGAYAGDGIGWLSTDFVSAEELQWLYETLEANRNKRCFIFNHVFPSEHKVGNPNNFYTSVLPWKTADNSIGQAYISLLRHYKNTLLFHGHSHARLSLQEKEKTSNYSDVNGYRSIHIPSLAVPRDIVNGERKEMYAESEGYIVDVYDNYIILNGLDFVDNKADGNIIPIATYKIDTELIEIASSTFQDDTGIIKINK